MENEALFERLPLMCSELMEWFRDRTEGEYGGTTCDDILARSPDRRACISLIAETYEKVLSILETPVMIHEGRV